MLVTAKDDATAAVFHQSAPNTAFGKVYQNNMDDDSYVGKKAIEMSLKNQKMAVYYSKGYAWSSPEFKNCKVHVYFEQNGSIFFARYSNIYSKKKYRSYNLFFKKI